MPSIASMLEEATTLHQQGALEDAESKYNEVIRLEPTHLAAIQLLGLIRNQVGDFEAGARCFQDALRLNPRSAMAHLNLGIALWNLHQLEEALSHFRYALFFNPDNPEALLNRSLVLQELERPGEAIDGFERVLKLQPDHPVALLHWGIALLDLERFDEAIDAFNRALASGPDMAEAIAQRGCALLRAGRHAEALVDLERALALEPDRIDALVNRAAALHQAKRSPEALVSLERALLIQPDSPVALLNRGLVLFGLRRMEEAAACFDEVLTLRADHMDALLYRGNALQELNRSGEAQASFEQALTCCDRTLALRPDHAQTLVNRGITLLALHRPSEALGSFEASLAVRPKDAHALMLQGNALMALWKPEQALASYDRALTIQPDDTDTLLNRALVLHSLSRHREAIASYDRILTLDPSNTLAHSSKIFVLDYLPEPDFQELQMERKAYCQAHASGFQAPEGHSNDRTPSRPLVLGYVSADFKHHSAAACFGPVLRHHDRANFKVVCYSGVIAEDDQTQGFRKDADLWRPTAGLSDDAMATQIQADGVDILIDLSGHSLGNRLLVFARKPAPIQVTAWGHGGGTGLPMIDYHFTDPVYIPAWARSLFAEASYDLPCAITFEAPAYAPPVAELPALAKGFVTFGSLNRFLKNTPEVLDLWARVLRAVPESRLILKDRLLEDSLVQVRVWAAFAKQGIGADRLDLRGSTCHRDHLATYNEVDIVLDPFPQNGGITTWEALWMGVPVITMPGNKPPSRVSGAILGALGMGDWVAENKAGYQELAIERARDLGVLARFRQESRARISASSAGNPDLYTKAVEEAYRTMWKRWVSK